MLDENKIIDEDKVEEGIDYHQYAGEAFEMPKVGYDDQYDDPESEQALLDPEYLNLDGLDHGLD